MKKNNALLVIVALSIFSNLFKTAYVFRSVSFGEQADYLQWSYAVFSVLILEVSILVLLANGSKFFPLLFALCTFAINVYYFNQFQFGDISQNIIEVIFAALFPAIIYRFSELYYSTTHNELSVNIHEHSTTENEIQLKLHDANIEYSVLQGEYESLQELYDELHLNFGEFQNRTNDNSMNFAEIQRNSDKWLEVVTCTKCGKVHGSPAAKTSHQYRCSTSQNPANDINN